MALQEQRVMLMPHAMRIFVNTIRPITDNVYRHHDSSPRMAFCASARHARDDATPRRCYAARVAMITPFYAMLLIFAYGLRADTMLQY